MDLSNYERLVGQDLEQPEQFRYEVTRDLIRQFAYCIPDYNALYLDHEYAFDTRWRGIIAPPGYLVSHGYGYSSWLRNRPPCKDTQGNDLDQVDNASDAWEFLIPVRPGDMIYTYSKLLSVESKTGKRIGEFALTRAERRFVNQRAELVARVTGQSFHFSATKVSGGGGMGRAYPPMPEGKTTRNVPGPIELPGMNPTPPRERRPQRFVEDVAVGEAITPWTIGPMSTTIVGKFNAATLGRGADHVGARQGGSIPDAFAPGPMRCGWFGAMLTRWGGPESWVTRINQQNREFLFVGFHATCSGTVTGKGEENGRHFVDCEIACHNKELGLLVNTGTARIELPSRLGHA
jgi:acyl dehydratase